MISLFVPAFNEAKNLEATVASILEASRSVDTSHLEIIIVNDASTDNTQEVIEALQKKYTFVKSIRHEKNQGLGAGFKGALQLARYEKFLVVPGDNDLAVASMRALIEKKDAADMVFLFFLNNEIRGVARHVLSTCFGLIYMATFGVILQYVNSPCLFPTKKLRDLKLRSDRFSIFAEANIKLLCQGSTFCEVAGYRQNGMAGSTSLSFKNFLEVVSSYWRLVSEIKFSRRNEFSRKPVRVAV